MSHDFTLVIIPGSGPLQAQLRLLDAHDNYLDSNDIDFNQFTITQRDALFNLQHHVSFYHDAGKEAEVIAETGVLIAEKVLGAAIFKHLHTSQTTRTLHIRLPAATGNSADTFYAALARIPWEIARPAPNAPPLSERALLACIIACIIACIMYEKAHEAAQPTYRAKDEADTLRVLFIFAEAQGSTPLGMRQERRALQDLFKQKIYPNRKIEAHFLAHGVTRAQLTQQISEHGGYHIVHWSGHGHQNALELAKPGGTPDHLSGQELLAMFHQPGVILPRLCFLSACHSGNAVQVENWQDFIHGNAPSRANRPEPRNLAPSKVNDNEIEKGIARDIDLIQPPALTGTAQALLAGGVPSIVAMRYAVGDDYARELALAFYQALLADARPKSVATALAQAREQVRKNSDVLHSPCDHATPLLFGADQTGLAGNPGRSNASKTVRRCLPGVGEFAAQDNFVGRTWELAALGSEFIDLNSSQAVAQITGLGGMGKTTLAAEIIDIWKTRFTWVLLFQAKPNELSLDSFLSDLHLYLDSELGVYHDHVKANPQDSIYRAPTDSFKQAQRQKRLADNLLLAMQNDAILLVLDNFETNLKPQAEPGGKLWATKDPDWDQFLRRLVQGLAQEPTRSRLLITCRRPLAVLAEQPCHWLQLGPLPAAEARLYLHQHPALSKMLYGNDDAEKILAQRVLNASRFHPLLMDRLARLCTSPASNSASRQTNRQALLQALQTLEHSHDYSKLPQLFASQPAKQGDATLELAYLQDALEQSIDELIYHAGDAAARVLWRVALANEAITFGLLETVWRGINPKLARLHQVKAMLANIDQQPPEIAEQLQALPPDVLEMLARLPDEDPDAEPMQPLAELLERLVSVGLLNEQRDGPDDDNPEYTCHELVRERSTSWAEKQPGTDPKPIWLAYAKRLSSIFLGLQTRNIQAALQAGTRAVVYCVQAQAYEQLGEFASAVVTSSNDVRLMQGLIPHLQAAVNAAPEGEAHWRCLSYLADALSNGGQAEASLPLYQQAASLAHAFAQTSGSKAAWRDFTWISGNWANVLCNCGQLDNARQRQLESAEAQKQAGGTAAH